MTVNDSILDVFSQWLEKQGKSMSTIHTYLGVLSKFQNWLQDHHENELTMMKEAQIQAYLDYLELKQLSAGTIEKNFAAISVFAKFLGKPQLMLHITRKEKIKSEEIPESLTADEKEHLLQEVERDGNLRNIAIVYTLLQTGIKVSELCSLNCSDVEITGDRGLMIIRNEKGEIDREIPLSNEVRYHMITYMKSLNPIDEDRALFVSSVYKRLTTRSVQYMLKKYNVNPHKLRHTFCQELVNNGVDLRVVAKLAGHRDINVTKRYSKHIKPDLASAINQTFA
ncbi:site-specific recombinase XerD [Oikeobacillus pervagus]|uniref:Site-specific recombinase XerD n=1 Tax=Oikeobacillus pervagus TaxID=1325931 RepID=A0AAJ1T0J9_9BACI|nr:tyrosine-type recombinase/integrase [Oikeobacillus pervagus]MDQ0216338.1 site-specific recombinase XerD [Oikeobacillus pervagus]